MSGFIGKQLTDCQREVTFREMLAERIARDGAIHIAKATGLFVARA